MSLTAHPGRSLCQSSPTACRSISPRQLAEKKPSGRAPSSASAPPPPAATSASCSCTWRSCIAAYSTLGRTNQSITQFTTAHPHSLRRTPSPLVLCVDRGKLGYWPAPDDTSTTKSPPLSVFGLFWGEVAIDSSEPALGALGRFSTTSRTSSAT